MIYKQSCLTAVSTTICMFMLLLGFWSSKYSVKSFDNQCWHCAELYCISTWFFTRLIFLRIRAFEKHVYAQKLKIYHWNCVKLECSVLFCYFLWLLIKLFLSIRSQWRGCVPSYIEPTEISHGSTWLVCFWRNLGTQDHQKAAMCRRRWQARYVLGMFQVLCVCVALCFCLLMSLNGVCWHVLWRNEEKLWLVEILLNVSLFVR